MISIMNRITIWDTVLQISYDYFMVCGCIQISYKLIDTINLLVVIHNLTVNFILSYENHNIKL